MQRKIKLMTTYKNSMCNCVYCVITIVEAKQFFSYGSASDMAVLNDARQGLKELERNGKCWYLITGIQKLWNKLGGKFPHNYWSIKSVTMELLKQLTKLE